MGYPEVMAQRWLFRLFWTDRAVRYFSLARYSGTPLAAPTMIRLHGMRGGTER